MIQSFGNAIAEQIWNRSVTKGFDRQTANTALRKLRMLNAAATINDLRIPPGNRLEKLAGSRRGQHSIRINDQWRVCFRWTKAGPAQVEIVDYH